MSDGRRNGQDTHGKCSNLSNLPNSTVPDPELANTPPKIIPQALLASALMSEYFRPRWCSDLLLHSRHFITVGQEGTIHILRFSSYRRSHSIIR